MTETPSESMARKEADGVLAALWSDRPRKGRGRNPSLAVDDICKHAVAIADSEGVRAVSMRKVAARMGSGAMSLYAYVSSKDDLIALMRESAICDYSEIDAVESWQSRVVAAAHHDLAMYQRHPWLLDVLTRRPLMGPKDVARLEWMLAAMEAGGLKVPSTHHAVMLVWSFVQGAARNVVGSAVGEGRALSGKDWWLLHNQVIHDQLDKDRFPRSRQIIDSARNQSLDAAAEFEFGLQCILDGLPSGDGT